MGYELLFFFVCLFLEKYISFRPGPGLIMASL